MSDEQPQKNSESTGDRLIAQSKLIWQKVVTATLAFAKKVRAANRRVLVSVRPELTAARTRFNTQTRPRMKAFFRKLSERIQTGGSQLKTKLRREAAPKADVNTAPKKSAKKAIETPEQIRARYDRQKVETNVSGTSLPPAAMTETDPAADEPDDRKSFSDRLNSGTRTVMTRMAAMPASIKTAYDARRQQSKAYKPYQYQGVRSRLKRHSRQKVYRLKGYTTIARVNRKRRREYIRRQRNFLLISVVLIVAIIIIFMWIDPIPKLRDLLHDLGFIIPASS